MDKIHVYIGRDEAGDLGIYNKEPIRKTTCVGDGFWSCGAVWLPIDDKLFPGLTWDDEPIEAELTINKITK